MQSTKQPIGAFAIAGMRHRAEWPEARLEVGDHVTLQAEPDNAYDPRAIKVIKSNRHVGYVPRAMTETFHPYLDNPELEAIVFDKKLDGKYPTALVQVIV